MTSGQPVLVIGASGLVGGAVVRELLDSGVAVRALSRRPDSAGLPPGVEVVAGDLTVPESLDTSLKNVDAVFLVWTAPPATQAPVIARIAAHTRKLVLLSSPHQTPHPFFQQPNPMARMHAEFERLIAAAGLDCTIIRPGMFAANTIAWWGSAIRTSGVVRWPYGAVETAPIDERDIAAVAARALREDGHAGRDYVVTGPEAVTQAAQVSAIGAAIGRPLVFEDLPPDEFRGGKVAGMPPVVADMLLAAWGAAAGRPAYVTSTVAEITGSPARSFPQWARDHAAAFA